MATNDEDQPVRKFVKPATPGAMIPDPAHPGLDIPDEGIEVDWDHAWIIRERRGEIIVSDPKGAAVEPASLKPPKSANAG